MRHFHALCLLIGLIAVAPTFAQSTPASPSMASILSGQAYPLTLKMKDLDASWTVIGQPLSITDYRQLVMTGTRWNTYTKGELVLLGGGSYLITYQQTPPDMTSPFILNDTREHSLPPTTPDTEIDLALVSFRSLDKITGIHPYSPDQFAKDDAEAAAQLAKVHNSASLGNLKELAIGIIQYCQDFKQTLPPMSSTKKFHDAIYPYEKSEPVFLDPASKTPYSMNTALSGMKVDGIKNPESIPVLWEPAPHPDGTRGVAFLDSHVKRLSKENWEALQKANHLPGQ